MTNPSIALAERLLQSAFPRNSRSGGSVCKLLSSLARICFAIALGLIVHGGQHLLVQKFDITIASVRPCWPRWTEHVLLGRATSRIGKLGFQSFHCETTYRGHTIIACTDGAPEGLLAPGKFESGYLTEAVTTKAGMTMPRQIFGPCRDPELIELATLNAIRSGFLAIDTCSLPQYYGHTRYEKQMGAALGELFRYGLRRDNLFLQVKIHPYDALKQAGMEASISKQIETSIRESLFNLGTSYADTLVLYWTYPQHEQTMEAWRAMEGALRSGQALRLGIANVKSFQELRDIYEDANIKPAVVQQPLAAEAGFQHEMRAWCQDKGIVFQSYLMFDLRTPPMDSDIMKNLAAKYDTTPVALFIRFIMGLGVVPITSPLMPDHASEDVSARSVELTAEDAAIIDELAIQAFTTRNESSEADVQSKQKVVNDILGTLRYMYTYVDDAKAGQLALNMKENFVEQVKILADETVRWMKKPRRRRELQLKLKEIQRTSQEVLGLMNHYSTVANAETTNGGAQEPIGTTVAPSLPSNLANMVASVESGSGGVQEPIGTTIASSLNNELARMVANEESTIGEAHEHIGTTMAPSLPSNIAR